MNASVRWSLVAPAIFSLALTGCGTLRSIKSEFESSKAFQRKVQCETYASKTEQEFKDAARELGGKTDIYYAAERVFYSPKRNSCVCVLSASSVVKGQLFEDIETVDTLTKEELSFKTYSGEERKNVNKDVEEQVRSLE